MTVKVETEEELIELSRELIHVLTNLRHVTKEWNKYYGGVLAGRKKEWEKRADELIEKMRATPTHQSTHVQVQINSASA
jgi:hypothetical protein